MRVVCALVRPSLAIAILASAVLQVHGQSHVATNAIPSGSPSDAVSAVELSRPDRSSGLPDAPDALPLSSAAESAGGGQRGGEPWEAVRHYGPLSRIGIGADVSPLGIGIKGATVLTEYIDGRLLLNFFSHDTGSFEVDTFKADAQLHLLSVGAALDVYPLNSIWRLSGGLLIHNGNNIAMTAEIVPGKSFTLNGQNFYSANPNPATGATPLSGSGSLGLNARQPELFLSGGFGRFVPRSNRHWSFPAEFGVIFMGAPTINITTNGWVCKDKAQTNCSNIADPSNPLAMQFNNALQAEEAKWRSSVSSFTVYPMFSYSVVYSFNFR